LRRPHGEGARGDGRAIKRKGGKAEVVPLDITDEAAVREQVETIIRRHRRIDVLVNNAGIIYREAIVDTSTDTFRSAIETDLVSQFMLAREVGRHMLAASTAASSTSPRSWDPGPRVGGRLRRGQTRPDRLTKNLAAEYGPHVTANAIAPGYIRTELNVPLQQNKDFNAMLERRTATHRWGKPEDLRGPLLLLASDAGPT